MLALLLALCLAGCGSGDAQEGELILVERETEEEDDTGVAVVTYQDVVSSVRVLCQYESVSYEKLSFDVERAEIDRVLVKEGESVTAGQLLISLVSSDDTREIRELSYKVERMEIELEGVRNEMEADITEAVFNIAVNDSLSEYERQRRQEKKEEEIRESYRNTLEDYEDRLEIARKRLAQLKKGGEDHQLYAGVSGLVTYVRGNLEGTRTVIGKSVIEIMDPTNMFFRADKPENAVYFTEGQSVELSISTGVSVGTYEVMPKVTEDEAGEQQLIFLLQGEDMAAGSAISEGTRASVTVETGRREHVLAIPIRALRKAGGKSYVYIVNDEGSRITRFIESGLEGNEYVEVLSGLEEGERVAVG